MVRTRPAPAVHATGLCQQALYFFVRYAAAITRTPVRQPDRSAKPDGSHRQRLVTRLRPAPAGYRCELRAGCRRAADGEIDIQAFQLASVSSSASNDSRFVNLSFAFVARQAGNQTSFSNGSVPANRRAPGSASSADAGPVSPHCSSSLDRRASASSHARDRSCGDSASVSSVQRRIEYANGQRQCASCASEANIMS